MLTPASNDDSEHGFSLFQRLYSNSNRLEFHSNTTSFQINFLLNVKISLIVLSKWEPNVLRNKNEITNRKICLCCRSPPLPQIITLLKSITMPKKIFCRLTTIIYDLFPSRMNTTHCETSRTNGLTKNFLLDLIITENMLDRVINTAWQPGFVVVRPLINDLVSTAFTGIFNKAFADFPFDEIIK